jgi:tetratricopeptide (TPR) repeat protein
LARFEAARRKEAAEQAQALKEFRKRQEELQRQASVARAKAAADLRARNAEQRKRLQTQRDRAAERLRQQAKTAGERDGHDRAVLLLRSAARLAPTEDVYRELGQTRAADKKARDEAIRAAQEKRDKARLAQAKSARKRILDEKQAREEAAAARKKAIEDHDQAVHDKLIKEAQTFRAKKEYEHALAAALAARKAKPTPDNAKLAQQIQDELTLAEAEKKSAAERKRAEDELKKRLAAQALAKKNQEAYQTALGRGQQALAAKRWDEAVVEYSAALKLFRTDAALSGLKTAQDSLAAEKKRKEEAAKKDRRLKDLLAGAQKAMTARDYVTAVKLYRQATQESPGNAAILARLSEAEHARDAALNKAKLEKDRKNAFDALMRTAKAALSQNKKPQAAKLLRQALELYPDNAEAKALLAKVDPKEDNYQLAMSAAANAMKDRNYWGAVNSCNAALKEKPNDPAALARRKEAQGLLEAAYQSAIKQARSAMQQQKWNDAVKAYDLALKQKPGDASATTGRAEALAKLKTPPPDPKEATYQKWMKQGDAALAARKWSDARNAYDEALKIKPGEPAAIKGKKAAADALKKESDAKTEAAYQALMKQAQAAMKAKKYADAVKAYDGALKIRPGDAAAIKGKKDAAAGLKPQVNAQAEYTKAMQRGAALEKQKKYADAVAAYRDALRWVAGDNAALKTSQGRAWLGVARNEHAAKRFTEAVKAYEVLKRIPNQPEARAALPRAKAGKP